MSDYLDLTFRIYLDDGFREEVAKFAEKDSIEDINIEDIIEYVNKNIKPARTTTETFMIEGGDTDGWFAQNVVNPEDIHGKRMYAI